MAPVVGGVPIASATATAMIGIDPGGVATGTDVTASFVQNVSWTGSIVELVLGNGAQTPGLTYVVTVLATLDDRWPTRDEVWLALPCTN